MKKAVIILGLFLAFAAHAQQKRSIGNYTRLNVKGSFDIILVHGQGQASITAKNENLYGNIKTEVSGDVLNIYMEKNSEKSDWGKITITLPYSTLKAISLSGSGSVTSGETIKSENMEITMAGSGKISVALDAENATGTLAGSGGLILKGSVNNLSATLTGSGGLKASELKAKNVEVELAGSGNASVYATGNLKARVVGSGDIKYGGNPKMEDTKVSGSGSIEKI